MLVAEPHRPYPQDQIPQLVARRDELVTSIEPMGIFTALDVPDVGLDLRGRDAEGYKERFAHPSPSTVPAFGNDSHPIHPS